MREAQPWAIRGASAARRSREPLPSKGGPERRASDARPDRGAPGGRSRQARGDVSPPGRRAARGHAAEPSACRLLLSAMAAQMRPTVLLGAASERRTASPSAPSRSGSRSVASRKRSRRPDQPPEPVDPPRHSPRAPARAPPSEAGPAARRAEMARKPSLRLEETSEWAVQMRAAPRARSEGGEHHEAEGAREGRRTSRRYRPECRGARMAPRTPVPRSDPARPGRPPRRRSGRDGRAAARDASASPCTRPSRS